MPSACSISIVCFRKLFWCRAGEFFFCGEWRESEKFFEDFSLQVLKQQNLPPGGFAELCESQVSQGGFSLTKAPCTSPGNWTKFNFMSRKYRAKFCREIKRDLALSTIRYFERCGARPKALPLETAAFWKRLAKTLFLLYLPFSCRGAWSFFFAYFLFLPKRK